MVMSSEKEIAVVKVGDNETGRKTRHPTITKSLNPL